jgi:hypothetical protein
MKFLNWIFRFINKYKTTTNRIRPLTDDEFNDIRSKKQKKLDDILDKVSKKGIESLSIHEKNFLNNCGKN